MPRPDVTNEFDDELLSILEKHGIPLMVMFYRDGQSLKARTYGVTVDDILVADEMRRAAHSALEADRTKINAACLRSN